MVVRAWRRVLGSGRVRAFDVRGVAVRAGLGRGLVRAGVWGRAGRGGLRAAGLVASVLGCGVARALVLVLAGFARLSLGVLGRVTLLVVASAVLGLSTLLGLRILLAVLGRGLLLAIFLAEVQSAFEVAQLLLVGVGEVVRVARLSVLLVVGGLGGVILVILALVARLGLVGLSLVLGGEGLLIGLLGLGVVGLVGLLGILGVGRRVVLGLVGVGVLALIGRGLLFEFVLLGALVLGLLGRQGVDDLDDLLDGFEAVGLRFLGIPHEEPVFKALAGLDGELGNVQDVVDDQLGGGVLVVEVVPGGLEDVGLALPDVERQLLDAVVVGGLHAEGELAVGRDLDDRVGAKELGGWGAIGQ